MKMADGKCEMEDHMNKMIALYADGSLMYAGLREVAMELAALIPGSTVHSWSLREYYDARDYHVYGEPARRMVERYCIRAEVASA
jgi:hypothetical protein